MHGVSAHHVIYSLFHDQRHIEHAVSFRFEKYMPFPRLFHLADILRKSVQV